MLNQAAQTAKRSPEFAATYATIAISRKLLTRAWHLLAGMQDTGTSTPPQRP